MVCAVRQEISAASAEARASKILHGLGFTEVMLRRATRDFSGGVPQPSAPGPACVYQAVTSDGDAEAMHASNS